MKPSALSRPLQLKIRVSVEEQQAFASAASARGQKLSEWVRTVLRDALPE
jgi:uncharacterized protein (DUF1778 family)